MDAIQKKVCQGLKYLTVALIAGSFAIILLHPRINGCLMRSSGSYSMYMGVFALLIAVVVYLTERLLADVFGADSTACYT